MDAFKAGVREFLQPPSFFEALGVRYVGPFDGHNIEEMEHALQNAIELSADGPILVHVLTQKGRGYSPAEDDDEKHLHDAPVFDPLVGPPKAVATGYTQAFAEAIIKEAEADPRIVAITAAMPGPTGLLPFQDRFPDRFFDVGIAEQHAVTGAAGMAMGGLRPIVAIYSTFLNRAWDQVVYDVALHRLPVIFCLDRAGVTGPDGPSHHGVYDMALLSKVPGMRVFAPSSAQELGQMLHDAMTLVEAGPVAIRYPRGAARQVTEPEVGSGLAARKVRDPAATHRVLHRDRQDARGGGEGGRSARRRRRRGHRVGSALLCPTRPVDDRRRRLPRAPHHDRGRHPRRWDRHGDRRCGVLAATSTRGRRVRPADEVHPARSEVGEHPRPLRTRRRPASSPPSAIADRRGVRRPPSGCCCVRAARPTPSHLADRRSQPEVARYQDWVTPYPIERAEEIVAELAEIDGPTDDEWWMLTIADADDTRCSATSWSTSPTGRTAEIGYTLAHDAWSRGTRVEAVETLVAYLFDTIGVSRVEAMLHPDNPASAMVLERLGLLSRATPARRSGSRTRTPTTGSTG